MPQVPFLSPLRSMTLLGLVAMAAAEDDFFVGPRALGMAGANVATTDDYTAQYYNPAAFGFFRDRGASGERLRSDTSNIGRKSWGFGFDASGGEQIQGGMAQYLDLLSSIDIQRLGQTGIQNQQDLQDVVKLANGLSHVADPGNAVTGGGTAGYGMRIGHWGLGARAYFQASARINTLDLNNLGLSSGNLNTQITNSGATGDGTVKLFTPAEQTQLTNAGLTSSSIQALDLIGRQQGVSAQDAQSFTNLLSQIATVTNGGGGSLSQNQTSVLIRGFGLGEIPLSYGRAFGEHFSVGASVKFLIGRVYGSSVLVFKDDASAALRSAEHNYHQSLNWGVDVGAMARLPHLEFGITGRNLNAPRFKGPTVNGTHVPDVTVDPQVTVGAAVLPFTTLALEVDCDLLRATTTTDTFHDQRLSGGFEWNIAHVLALRAGAYKNIAESNTPWVATAGVGLNLYVMRLDLAVGASPKRDTIDGKTYPREADAALGLMVDF